MRTFIAIEISDDICGALAQIQSRLKYAGADVKWVEPRNIHLTLKFLGEITEEKAGKIKSILDDIGSRTKPFEINLKEIGAFPRIESPRVIWVGLDKGAKESVELAGRIDDELSNIGFAKESRPFAAHLTLGRVKSPKNKEVLKEKVMSSGSFQLSAISCQLIKSIVLFKSTLTPHGSIYTKLHESHFKAES
ncbi:MAG: RNA 2',3'-cyclic phosphodiesterase [Candidatus Omnitrophota bacterium]